MRVEFIRRAPSQILGFFVLDGRRLAYAVGCARMLKLISEVAPVVPADSLSEQHPLKPTHLLITSGGGAHVAIFEDNENFPRIDDA